MRSRSFGSCCEESSQNLAVFPSLISQKQCRWTKCLCCIAAFHMIEPALSSDIRILSSIGLLLAYLAVHKEAQGVLGWSSQRHHNLAPMTVLLRVGSRIPMPPDFLGRQTLSHLTNAHLRFLAELPQRKLRWRFLMALITHFGAAERVNK